MNKISSLGLSAPIIIVGLIIITFVVIELNIILPAPSQALLGNLTTVDQEALTMLKDLTELLVSLGLAIIGATAFFLKAAVEGAHKLSKRSLLAAECVILFVVISIFFGHMMLNAILNMLAIDIFNSRDPSIVIYGIAQYAMFILSLLVFFLFVHITFWTSISED